MMKCLATDATALFSSNEFGEDAVVRWRGFIVPGAIFDDEDIQVELGEGVGEIVHQSVLTAPSAYFVGIAEGDEIEVRGEQYLAKYWKDDGTGIIEVFLEAR